MDKNYKIIIGLLVIIVLILLSGVMMISNSKEIPLQEDQFGFLKIDTPKDSYFSVEVNHGTKILLTNKGDYSDEAFAIMTKSKNEDNSDTGAFVFQNQTGDIEVYKSDDTYRVDRIVGDYRIMVRGDDLDLITRMINTAEIVE